MKRANILLIFLILLMSQIFIAAKPSTVYITDTGNCYHLSFCHSLNNSKRAISLFEAERLGYRACYFCMDGNYESGENDGSFSNSPSGTTSNDNYNGSSKDNNGCEDSFTKITFIVIGISVIIYFILYLKDKKK